MSKDNKSEIKLKRFSGTNEEIELLRGYFIRPEIEFCDMTIGAKYIWRDEFKIDYAIIKGSLVIKESCPDYDDYFYYPLGGDVVGAIESIERHCQSTGLPLNFCCIDNKAAAYFSARYPFARVYNDRNWSDYIYDAEKFKTYSGKKYGGQRNHVNKFKKLYPDFAFKVVDESDFPAIREFLNEFERGEDFSMWSKKEEERKVYDYILNFKKLGNVGGLITVGGKVVAISFGERMGDTLVVHIEKGLKNYEGVYPVMANEFAKAFATDGVKYVNREEDCGDMGLRVSKLQYNPVEIKEKNFVIVGTLFDKIAPPVSLCTPRLTITDIFESDSADYFRLYTDGEINAFYGYDYREDYSGELLPPPTYFMDFMRSLKAKKEEYSLAVRVNGVMAGEIVIYNFDYFAGVEIGFRFFKQYRGKGYALESVRAVMDYLAGLNTRCIKCRAFKQNVPSVRLIERLGFEKCGENEEQYFYRYFPPVKKNNA